MFGGGQGALDAKIDWDQVGKRDQERRDAVRKLLADGKLQTGYLLAHVLSVTAVSKGDSFSKWLTAATMDRYLQWLNQPQVFGTQFRQPEGIWTMEPYDRTAF